MFIPLLVRYNRLYRSWCGIIVYTAPDGLVWYKHMFIPLLVRYKRLYRTKWAWLRWNGINEPYDLYNTIYTLYFVTITLDKSLFNMEMWFTASTRCHHTRVQNNYTVEQIAITYLLTARINDGSWCYFKLRKLTCIWKSCNLQKSTGQQWLR